MAGRGAARRISIFLLCLTPLFSVLALSVATAALADTVKVAMNRNFPFLAMWVAKDRGYFKARGVEVEFHELGGGSEMRTAVLSGSVDMAIQSPEGSALLYQQGQRLINVVATQGKLPWVLMLAKEHRGKVKPGELLALKGLKIGVTGRGSASDLQLQALLRRAGLVPDQDVRIVPGAYSAILAAMERGQLDGVMAVQPATAQAADIGGFAFVDFSDGEVYPGSSEIPAGALAAPASYLAAHDGTVTAMVDAVVDAMVYMNKNSEPTSVFVSSLSGLSVEKVRAMAEREFVKNSPMITERGWNTLVQILKTGGVIKGEAPYELLVASKFRPQWQRYFDQIR